MRSSYFSYALSIHFCKPQRNPISVTSTANVLTTRIVNIQLLVIMAADFGILRTDVVDLWLAMFPHEIVRGRLGAIGGDKKPAGREPAGYRRGPGA